MLKLRKTLYISMVYLILAKFSIAIALLSLGVIVYVFFMVNEKQMKIKHDIERTRQLRIRGNEGKKGGNV
jgi:hypothetical protein